MTVTTLLVFRQGEIDTESVGFVNGDGRSYGGTEYGEGEHEAQDASTDAGNRKQRNGGPVPPSCAMGV